MDSFIEKIEKIYEKFLNIWEKLLNKVVETYNSDSFSFIRSLNFELHHLRSIFFISLLTFFVTFYFTGMNTTEVKAFNVSTTVKTYNSESYNISYAHTDELAEIAKDILSNKISVLCEPIAISTDARNCVYQIENYIAMISLLGDKALGEVEAEIKLMTLDTYNSGNANLAEFYCEDGYAEIKESMVCIYKVKLNLTDSDAPRILLNRSDITISESDSFNPAVFLTSITDNYDGTIYSYNVEGNDVGEDGELEPGKHILTYKVVDSSGNESCAQLIVRVKEEVKASETSTYASYKRVADSPYAGSIVAEARSLIGSAYVYGANGPYAFDCSGLVQYVYARAGIYVPRTSGSQAYYGQAINPYDMSQWRAGDIVTFGPGGSEHAAIYSGNGTLIHAMNPADGVKETGVFGNIFSVRRP